MQLRNQSKIYKLLCWLLPGLLSFSQRYKPINAVKGLAVSSKVKMFSAVDAAKKAYQLSDPLKKGPALLLFYRGRRCPVCNRHVSRLQDSPLLIYDEGTTRIAESLKGRKI